MPKIMDIVERLRLVPKSHWAKISKDERYLVGEVAHEAAKEIERLRTELEDAIVERNEAMNRAAFDEHAE